MGAALLMLGSIVDAASAKTEIEKSIVAKQPVYASSFREFAKYAFDEPARNKALILPPGTVIKGDLILDWSKELTAQNVVAIVAQGDLKIEGSLINTNFDGGPFLFVAGKLEAKRIDKRGAFVAVLGDVRLKGPSLCEYNHGGLLIGGDLTAEWLLNLDHDVTVSGQTHGPSLSGRGDDLREALVPEVFGDDDPENGWPEGDLIRKRIAAGAPVLRPGR
jgi:hypothetical protein